MKTLFDMISAPAMATYWTEKADMREPLLGEAMFPNDKKLGLDLAFIKGHKDRAVALAPSAFDARATLRDRIGVEKIETEMPFFREAMTIKEKDRQELLRTKENDPQFYDTIIKTIFDDAMTLLEGALIQPERMRMGLIAYGKFGITANNTQYDYDYDVTGDWATNNITQLSGTSAWTDLEKAKPVEDIREMQEKIEEVSGTKPMNLVMSRKVFNLLMENKSVRMDMDRIGGQNIIMTEQLVKNYFKSKLDVNIVVYTKRFRDENKVTKLYYPEDRVSFLPTGNLGKTWFGTTPEEADLMVAGSGADVKVVETGVAITVVNEVHPVNKNTIVSEIVLPSFERMDECGVLIVK